MPDLSQEAVHQFWKEFNDPFIYKVISFMEGVEEWTKDGDPQVEAAINELGIALDDVGNVELKQEQDFINLVACLNTGRGLRILMALDMAYPGAASKIIMFAEGDTKTDADISGVFLKRNIIFERLRLLGRIFSKERIKLIEKALEESDYD